MVQLERGLVILKEGILENTCPKDKFPFSVVRQTWALGGRHCLGQWRVAAAPYGAQEVHFYVYLYERL